MAMLSEGEKELAAIEDMAAVVLVKLRSFHFSQGRTDPQEIRRALQDYADRCIEFINQNRG